VIIQNLFDTNLWYGLREINVLKSVNKYLFCQKLEKVGKKLLILFIYQNLGKGITLNIGLLSIHRYLIRLFLNGLYFIHHQIY
jgi:hypothetical protein